MRFLPSSKDGNGGKEELCFDSTIFQREMEVPGNSVHRLSGAKWERATMDRATSNCYAQSADGTDLTAIVTLQTTVCCIQMLMLD